MNFNRALLLIPLVVSGARLGALAVDPAAGTLAALRHEIARHDQLYFRDAAPEIADADYDRLKQRLAGLEAPRFDPTLDLPASVSFGDDRSGQFATHRHGERMLSLEKVYSEAEARAFYSRIVRKLGQEDACCVVEPKYDGVAISITYESGRMVRATTRGDGTVGDDVTENVRAIEAVPARLRAVSPDGSRNAIPDLIELRGEIYLPLDEFTRINAERKAGGEAPFSHPRNVAAATLKRLDHDIADSRRLSAVFYGVGACAPAGDEPATQQELHRLISRWGLPGVDPRWEVRNADEMWSAIEELGQERPGLVFPTDGAVVKIDSIAAQHELGATDHAPRWAVAFKYPPERAETKLLGIKLQVGRSGVLTPVAEFAPVRLGGALVTQASLYNRAEITRQGLRVGDVITVEKSGDVIPTVAGVDLQKRPSDAVPFEFPRECPECQAPVEFRDDQVAISCPNYDCPAQVHRRLQHFASKAGVDIPGLGPVTLDRLIWHHGVKGIPDLYRLRREELADDVSNLGGERAVARLLGAIERSKGAELARFIRGLGIPKIGIVAAKDLAARFSSLEELMAAARSTADAAMEVFRGTKPAVAAALAAFFEEPRNRDLVVQLVAAGIHPAISRGANAVVATAASPAEPGVAGTEAGESPDENAGDDEEWTPLVFPFETQGLPVFDLKFYPREFDPPLVTGDLGGSRKPGAN
ncbi:MAG: ligase LigA [Verrucomicrobia bacterium]|nr:ligase LigA [Verrucomicrobiota bacterium]